jgi:hypothetical protein
MLDRAHRAVSRKWHIGPLSGDKRLGLFDRLVPPLLPVSPR